MILIIDNYDSFTYNLLHYIYDIDQNYKVEVRRNDEITVEETQDRIDNREINHIVISPGPSTPEKSAICPDLVKNFYKQIPILGVCLGHQVIGQIFGGEIIIVPPMHGKISTMKHYGTDIFQGVKNPFKATRYHSLAISKTNFPDCLEILCLSEDDDLIMGLKHKEFPLYGVQFHPESIASEEGHHILQNFLTN